MDKKALINTNPYLRDRATRERFNEESIISSFGVEGIKIKPSDISGIHYSPKKAIKKPK